MKPLSELLQEARMDAPPPRYDVDQVVAAGRRRVRRRNSGWALAAVVAVATAIGVPQIASRGPAPSPAQPAASVTPAPTSEYLLPSVARFRGYRTASFKVGDPASFGPGYTASGAYPIKGLSPMMSLTVYEPGIDPLARLSLDRVAGLEPIKGRPAFTASSPRYAAEALVWEYAENAFAVLTPDARGTKPEQMREVAEGFGLAPERPVRLAFKVGNLPGGFRLRAINQDDGNEFSAAYFLPLAAMRAPVSRRDEAIDGTKGSIDIVLERLVPGGAANCGCLAYRKVGDGHQVTVSGSISKAEARKILDSVDVSTPTDFAAWVPIAEAVPEAYLFKGE